MVKALARTLDSRGGYFSQSDVHEALFKQGNLEVNKVHLEKLAADRKMSVSGFFTHAHGSWKNYLVTWMSEVRQCLTRTDIYLGRAILPEPDRQCLTRTDISGSGNA